jgi:thiopeptide-type bacteriocin biosynthesis protein
MPSLMLRAPTYNFADYKSYDGLVQLLKENDFRRAIALASKSLYTEMASADFHMERLPAKVKTALLRYYNRMCFRPTPFGLFSSITSVKWGTGNSISLGKENRVHALYNFSRSLSISTELINSQLSQNALFRTNESLYSLKQEYRFTKHYLDPSLNKKLFFLQSLERSLDLDNLLTFLSTYRSRGEITKYLKLKLNLADEVACTFIDELYDEQIIVSSLRPTVTGDEYLSRVLSLCNPGVQQDFITGFPNIANAEAIAASDLYINSTFEDVDGSLNLKYKEKILEGLFAIDKLSMSQEPQGLRTFIDQFKSKFDRQLIPLVVALDPELGVGYDAMATDVRASILLKDIHIKAETTLTYAMEWTPIHAYLMQQWHNLNSETHTIELTQDALDNLPQQKNCIYPSSISVLFRVVNNLIFVEQAGGNSATALLGRFTLFNEQLFQEAHEISRIEQATNPDIIFAEISHYSDFHTANIDRRKNIRDFEITILAGASEQLNQQIILSDLWVTVIDETIILWSKQLKKRIIPRLSSAYNYLRDDLSIFRFLCDLQYQGLKSSFSFSLSKFFPNMRFYPRVQYRNCILHLAEWHIFQDKLTEIQNLKTNTAKLELLQAWCAELKWPRYISLADHDNQLVFDVTCTQSLFLLIQHLKGTEIVIKEFLLPEAHEKTVVDHTSRPTIHQFIASLFHNNCCYKGIPEQYFEDLLKEQYRKLIPGSEWLYFKLYCHPTRSNEILTDQLLPFLTAEQQKQHLNKWFFVRYRDSEYHLRIRLHVEAQNIGSILLAFKEHLNEAILNGLVSDFQICTYEREIERYSPFLIEDIEMLFFHSSAFILNFIKTAEFGQENAIYYKVAFYSINRMANIFRFTTEDRAVIFQKLFHSLLNEFGSEKQLSEQLRRKYRTLRNDHHIFDFGNTNYFYTGTKNTLLNNLEKSCTVIAEKIVQWPEAKRSQLFGDIVHMHLNRLLVDNARMQEMLIYFCFWKNYQTEKGKHALC